MRLLHLYGLALLGCLMVSAVEAADSMDGGARSATPPDSAPNNLAAFVHKVLDENPAWQAARSAVAAAQARARAAGRPLYNPTLEIEAENSDSNTASLGISQTVDWSNKRGAQRDMATFEAQAVHFELAATRVELSAALLAALGRYHSAAAKDQMARQRSQLMQRFLDLAEKRQKAGDLNQVELELARLAHTQALLEQARASAAQSDAEQGLIAISGAPPPRGWPKLPAALPSPAPFATQTLLDRLPAVQAQRARIAAADAQVTLRQRNQRADPSLGLRGGREESEALVGLTLSIPLFVRNNFSAETEAASAELSEAQLGGQDAYRRARAQLHAAAARYRLTHDAWGIWTQSGQTNLSSRTALLERLWQAGEFGTADYLLQLNQTLDTQKSALELQADLWLSWIDWLTASGQILNWLNESTHRLGEQQQ